MRIPVNKPLPPKSRAAHNIKRGYDVLIDVDGNPAKKDDSEGVWKRVKNKNRDADRGVMQLTFIDKTVLFIEDNAALYSRRVEDPETDMRKTREEEAAALAAKYGLKYDTLTPAQKQAFMLALKDVETE